RAALAELFVVAVGEHGQELVRLGRPGRGLQLGLAGFQPAVADVLARAAGEDRRLLRDERDGAAQFGGVQGADVDAVEVDAAELLLQAPDGPTGATVSPGATRRLKSSSAGASGRDG